MNNGLDNTAKPAPVRPRPVVAIPESVLNGTMTPAQAAQAEVQRQRNNPSAVPIIPLEVQDQQHVTAWLIAAPIEIARLRARADAEQAMLDGTFHEKLAASRAAQAARAANTALPTQSATWSVWNALAAVGLVAPATSVPADNPNRTTVSTPPMMPDMQDDDASASNTNEPAPLVVVDPALATTLAELNEQDVTVQERPAVIAPLHDADPVIVSPPLAPALTGLFMEEEITLLEEADETGAPQLEAEDELEERVRLAAEATAERERLDEIERVRLEAEATAERERLEKIERERLEAEATAERESQNRIEQARVDALAAAAQQQTLLLQQQREREEVARQVEESRRQALLDAAAERQRAIDAGIAAARAAGF